MAQAFDARRLRMEPRHDFQILADHFGDEIVERALVAPAKLLARFTRVEVQLFVARSRSLM